MFKQKVNINLNTCKMEKAIRHDQSKRKEIDPKDIWNDESRINVKDFIINHSKKQSTEQRLKNELMTIQYQIEDYLQQDKITRKV